MPDDSSTDDMALRPREEQTLRAAWISVTEFGIARYLVSDGQVRSAERLIAREMLVKVKDQTQPPLNLVVTITGVGIVALMEHHRKLKEAAHAPG